MKTYKQHKPKKSLGQNFLKSIPALQKIIETGEITSLDVVLEIGPGRGVLTEKLLEKARLVIAVEKDRELFEFLKIKFEKEIKDKKLLLIQDDILNFDVNTIISVFINGLVEPHLEFLTRPGNLNKNPKILNYKIIANIPYNITGAIIKKFLTDENQPERMVLLVQQEVAQRIISRDKKESILSISVKSYGEPKIIMKVPARYFSPAPKVDSAIISIKNISRKMFVGINEENFWKIVRAGFAHKRKKLSNNLKKVISLEKLEEIGLKDKRAEDLLLKDWLAFVK